MHGCSLYTLNLILDKFLKIPISDYCKGSTLCEASGTCLTGGYICNGVTDCPDGSDENNCKSEMKTCDGFLQSGSTLDGIYQSGSIL